MPKKPLLQFIAPMQASSVEELFDSPDWIFETKLDGYRAIAVIDSAGKVRIWSRNPEARENKRRTIFHFERIRNSSLGRFLPFVKAVGRNQASALLKRPAKGWGYIDLFCSGVEKTRITILAPVGDQTPRQRIQASVLRFWIEPDREHGLARRNIIADRQIRLSRNRDAVDPS